MINRVNRLILITKFSSLNRMQVRILSSWTRSTAESASVSAESGGADEHRIVQTRNEVRQCWWKCQLSHVDKVLWATCTRSGCNFQPAPDHLAGVRPNLADAADSQLTGMVRFPSDGSQVVSGSYKVRVNVLRGNGLSLGYGESPTSAFRVYTGRYY